MLRNMANAFPAHSSDVPTRPRCARLLPHALVAAAHAERVGVEAPATSWLLDRAGFYLAGRGQFDDARVLIERALAIAEATGGPGHPTVAVRLNNLAAAQRNVGEPARARVTFQRALDTELEIFGPDDPRVAVVLTSPWRCRTRWRSTRRRTAPTIPNVATDLNNLASVLRDLGDHAVAREGLKRALAINEAAHAPNTPTWGVASTTWRRLRDLRDLDGAREGFERAVAIAEAAHGSNHPGIGRHLANLATVPRDPRVVDAARQSFGRALRIAEAANAPGDPTTEAIRAQYVSLSTTPETADANDDAGDSRRRRG